MNEQLLARMHELRDLTGIIGLATWDQETYLPRKADAARSAQLATLQGLYHEHLVDPRLGDWLAAPQTASADEEAMVRVLRHERDRAVKIPPRLVKALAEAQGAALNAWRAAREARKYSIFEPKLDVLIGLRREQADAWGHDGERYDALLEGFEPGMRVTRLMPVLERLKAQLVPLIGPLEEASRAKVGASMFGAQRPFDVEQQWAFTLEILQAMGFDLEAGRQDRSVHPFTGGTHQTDVRLTTRLFASQPLSAIFSTIHEGGHGLFEQGFDPAHARTPLAQAPSMGLHESQSRLWENLIGRGRPFWSHFLPLLAKRFDAQLGGVSLDQWLFEVNRVERSLIRVEADEVTYNLHIVLRTQLELELMRGSLSARELESAWNEKSRMLLGIEVPSPELGVLQDIHWAWGEFGYFPTYSLGNLYSATLYQALHRALPTLDADVAKGHLLPIRDWLRVNVHRQGYRHDAETLVRKATGTGLSETDFVDYIKRKYGALHGLSF